MSQAKAALLPQRSFVFLAGEDRRAFLQGLVSCDVTKLTPAQPLWGAMLTAQGKFLYDFFLIELGDVFLLEVEAARAKDFLKKLSMYKLRAKVVISEAPEWAAAAAFGGEALARLGVADGAKAMTGGVAYADPRLAEAGARLVLPAKDGLAPLLALGFAECALQDWQRQRLELALPEGSDDLIPDKTLLLEAGFDELAGVDWQKGCYLGQELTARTKYRGLIKKRLLKVRFEGSAPAPGTPVTQAGAEAGELHSGVDGLGLALLRLEALDKQEPLECGGKILKAETAPWMILPKAETAA